MKNDDIQLYYRNNLNKLTEHFSFPINETLLHKSRKIIKDLLYPLKLMPTSLVNKLNLNESYLDYLQENIGSWHDAVITLQLLDNNNLQQHANYQLLCKQKEAIAATIKQSCIDFDKKVIGASL